MVPIETILYTAAIGLIVIGLAGLYMVNNIFRMVLALAILESGANLLLVLAGFKPGTIAPIILDSSTIGAQTLLMSDPIVQALVLTAIVIGVGVQALALAIVFRIRDRYQTLDMRVIRHKMEQDIATQAGVSIGGSYDSPADTAKPQEGGA